jgi:hypothetical protein
MKTLLLGSMIAGTATAATLPVGISQQQAFAALGHSCGGISINEYATGFDVSGNPQADVYLVTHCSSGGRGSRTVTYSAWEFVTWDLGGNVISSTPIGAPSVTPPALVFTHGPYTESDSTIYYPPLTMTYHPVVLTTP